MAYTQVILKEKISGLGAEADVVKVRAGFARNWLLPQGKAYEATTSNLRHTEALKSARVAREAAELVEAEKISAKMKKMKLKMTLATGATGKAFGSITTNDIAKAINAALGSNIDRHQIHIEGAIKTVGKHEATVRLHPEVECTVKIDVTTVGAVAKADNDEDEDEAKAEKKAE
jgi:large subunit ribosomal protein L9